MPASSHSFTLAQTSHLVRQGSDQAAHTLSRAVRRKHKIPVKNREHATRDPNEPTPLTNARTRPKTQTTYGPLRTLGRGRRPGLIPNLVAVGTWHGAKPRPWSQARRRRLWSAGATGDTLGVPSPSVPRPSPPRASCPRRSAPRSILPRRHFQWPLCLRPIAPSSETCQGENPGPKLRSASALPIDFLPRPSLQLPASKYLSARVAPPLPTRPRPRLSQRASALSAGALARVALDGRVHTSLQRVPALDRNVCTSELRTCYRYFSPSPAPWPSQCRRLERRLRAFTLPSAPTLRAAFPVGLQGSFVSAPVDNAGRPLLTF